MRRCFVQSKFHPHSIVYHALFAGQSLLDERYASALVTYTNALDNFRKLADIGKEDAESNARMQFALHAGMAVAAGKRSCSRKCTDSRRTLLTAIHHYQQLLIESPFIALEERLLMAARVAYLLERFSDAVRLVHRCIRLLSEQNAPQGFQWIHAVLMMKQSILPCTDACNHHGRDNLQSCGVFIEKASMHLHAKTQQEHYCAVQS